MKQENKLTAVIVDDEPHCREALKRLLAVHCPEILLLQECCGVEEAVRAIARHRPDLLFLDVELPDGTGFDVLERALNPECGVVFTTAYNEYALRAIKFSALDYLLKPVTAEELSAAVSKALRVLRQPDHRSNQLRVLRSLLRGGPDLTERIAVPTMDGFTFVGLKEIVWCGAESNYTRIHLERGESILTSRTMKEFEELLEERGFFRIHHSRLINLAHLRRYVKGKGGYVVMSDGRELEVSVRRKDLFVRHLEGGR